MAASPKVQNKVARHLTAKIVSNNRLLLSMAPGHGVLVPPHWPYRIRAEEILEWFSELFQDHATESMAPRGGLERQVNRMAGWD